LFERAALVPLVCDLIKHRRRQMANLSGLDSRSSAPKSKGMTTKHGLVFRVAPIAEF